MYYSLARSPLRLPGSADTYNINQYTYSILQYYSYIVSYIYIFNSLAQVPIIGAFLPVLSMLRIGLGMGPGKASPLVRSRA